MATMRERMDAWRRSRISRTSPRFNPFAKVRNFMLMATVGRMIPLLIIGVVLVLIIKGLAPALKNLKLDLKIPVGK